MAQAQLDAHTRPLCKVLIVDDEEKICTMLRDYFAHKRYDVRSVRRGAEALVLTDVFQPDVVVLDLLMPGMDGIETLKRLKTYHPAPKVIMLSVADDEEVARGALRLGADFYMCKPVDLSELERLVTGFIPPTADHHA